MMTKIESYEELKRAKAQSKRRLKELEQLMKDEVEEIKNDLRPLNIAGRTVRNLLTSEKHGIVSESLGMGINALVKNLLFRRTNFITKSLIAFAAKNIANNAVSNNADQILGWVQSSLRKLKSRHHQNGHYYDESTADIDLGGQPD